MPRRFRPAFSILVSGIIALAALPPTAVAGDRDGLQELAVTTGYGFSTRDNVQVVPLYLRFGWHFPEVIDEPLARNNLNLKWFLEPWIAGVTNHQNAIEVGIT